MTFSTVEKDERTYNLVRMGQLLTHVLDRVGVVPDTVVGYSVGEWTAGLVAGLVDPATLLTYGALLQPETPHEDLALAVLGLGATTVEPRLADYPGTVISHDNSPTQSVVCGPSGQVTRLVADLRRDDVACQPLPFATALHTPYMASFLAPLRELQARSAASPRPGTAGGGPMAMWSPTLAGPAPQTAEGVRELYLRQLVEPVRFRSTITAMYDAGVRVFLQLGPGQVASLVQDNLRDRAHLAMPVNVVHHSGLNQLRRVAAALWVEGATPNLRALDPPPGTPPATPARAKRPGVRLRLGTVPFTLGDGADMILNARIAGQPRPAADPAGDGALAALREFGERLPAAAEFAALLREAAESTVAVLSAASRTDELPPEIRRFPLLVSVSAMPYLRDHCFFQQPGDWPNAGDRWPVVPATAVIQHLVDAVERAEAGSRVIRLSDARFHRWLLAEPAQDVEIAIRPAGDDRFDVSCGHYSQAAVVIGTSYPPSPPAWRHDPASERPGAVDAPRMYGERILFHGPEYQGLVAVHGVGERHARGSVRALAAPGALLDAGWHLLSAWLVSTQPERTVAYPVSVGSLAFYGPPPPTGSLLECVGRLTSLEEGRITGDVQFIADGRVWAQLDDCVHRRFDSPPRLREQERFPGRHAVSVRQSEGWTMVFDCWTDPMSQAFTAHHVLGAAGFADYDKQLVSRRKSWILGRLAVKDAVRYGLWASGAGDVFPIEVRVSNDPDGRPRVSGWPGRTLPEYDVSLSHTGEVAVALARPAQNGTGIGTGIGIDVAEVTRRPDSTLRLALSDAELALLGELAPLDGPEIERDVWFTRFWAAKEAVAKAEGTGLDGAPWRFAVSAPTADTMTVQVGDRCYQVIHRDVNGPGPASPRHYVVAWTWGPQWNSTKS